MLNKIECLRERHQFVTDDTCVGVIPPSNRDLMNKMNEIIEVINQLIDERGMTNEETKTI